MIYKTTFLSSLFITLYLKYNPLLTSPDLLKPNYPLLPNCLGIAPALSFIITYLFFTNNYPFRIIFLVLLGILDDIYELKWRYKLIFPFLINFLSERKYFIKKNYFIKVLIKCFLAVFSVNSINILSGINGLEVSQSLIISFFMYRKTKNNLFLVYILSLLPLFIENTFPACVFGGNVFTSFSGMTLFCLSEQSDELLYFLKLHILQIINFIISIPQLVGILPCPRHRMPNYNLFYIIPSKINNKGGVVNLTLLNIILLITGPIKEDILFYIISGLQLILSLVIERINVIERIYHL